MLGSKLPQKSLPVVSASPPVLAHPRQRRLCHSSAAPVTAFVDVRAEITSLAQTQRGDDTATASVSGREVSRQPSKRASPSARDNVAPLELPKELMPSHVAIIMDGNARWALSKGLPILDGHEAGVDALRRTVQCCLRWGIPALTVFAFSAENWNRGSGEVRPLLQLIERVSSGELQSFLEQGISVRFMGSRGGLPHSLQRVMSRIEERTASGQRLRLTVALDYGGQQDLTQAVRSIAEEVARGALAPEEVDGAAIERRLGLSHLPPEIRRPDLLIRSSGELRVSNFLLWEIAYCELYFTRTRWPEFGEADFRAALHDFYARQRRFGRR